MKIQKNNNKLDDRDRRAKLTKIFLDSPFYNEYFKPDIEEEINNARDISKLDDKDIERSYLKKKVRLDVYRGILLKLEKWAKI